MTEEIKDSNAPFPAIDNWKVIPGMSLRDYFAATAPITVWDAQVALNKGSLPLGMLPENARKEVFAMIAKLHFEYADAMVAASEAK